MKAPPTRGMGLGDRLSWIGRTAAASLDRLKMSEHVFGLLVAIVIGALCGVGAVFFNYLIHAFQGLFWGTREMAIGVLRNQPWWRIALMPGLGGLLVGWIVYHFAKEARGHGVPEVMAAVALRGGIIRARVALAKVVASAITIASGGSAGREGPVIQIGAAIGSVVGQLLRVSRRRLRTFVGCGAAGGIAATFNAPVAGALFSVEIILGEFGVAQFSPIVISSVIATVVARHYLGSGPVFEVPHYTLASGWELLPYAALGLLCGAVSAGFIRLLYLVEDFFERARRLPGFLRPMAGGFLLGLVGLVVPHVYGDGRTVIDLALLGQLSWFLLAALLAAKIVATSLTLGSGGSGGVFAPSLFLGAMAGGLVGRLAAHVPGIATGAPGGYALVGMGGVVAGATHAPITAILIIFEMTGSYDVILPLMTVCIISTVLSSRLSRESIYTLKLVRRGIDLFRGRSLDVLKPHTVAQCLRTGGERVVPGQLFRDILKRILRSEHTQFYGVDEDGTYRGVLTLADARRVFLSRENLEGILLVEDLLHTNVPVCTPGESLSEALHKFTQSAVPELPVVEDMRSRHFCGVLNYADVISVYQGEILKLDAAGGLASRVSSTPALRRVQVVEGFSLAEWDPPSSLWGRNLREAALRARYGLHVVLVKKKSATAADRIAPLAPGPDYTISAEDTLVVYGRDEDVEKVLKM